MLTMISRIGRSRTSASITMEIDQGGDKMNEGWTWLINSRKWHYFRDSRSLCGKFALFDPMSGDLERGNDDSPDNCAACKRKLEKEKRT